MTLSKEEIINLLNSKPWFHKFEIVKGIHTPGTCQINPDGWVRERFPEDITNQKFLEIGTWDGPYSFALEKKGAMVEATDIQDPDNTGFNVGKKILNSQINYTQTSVYDVDKYFEPESFDVILFLGVFYHLKYPVLALEKLVKLLKKSGKLYFEGECLLHYGTRTDGKNPNFIERLFIRKIANSDYPISLYYSDKFQDDDSNWHIPNFACLQEWMKTVGLEIQKHKFIQSGRWGIPNKSPYQRVEGFATKIGDIKIEHGLVGEN
ncbi:MAG: class I SAM-dependent methyltransferase [Crocosphaera sp.]